MFVGCICSFVRQRTLTTEDKAIAVDMLKLKSSKKLLQVFIHEQTGKVVTLRDVSNIQTNMRCHDANDLTKVVTRLRAMEGMFGLACLIYYGSSNKLVYLVFLCVHYSDTLFYVLIVRLTVLMWYFAFALMQSCRTVLLRSYII